MVLANQSIVIGLTEDSDRTTANELSYQSKRFFKTAHPGIKTCIRTLFKFLMIMIIKKKMPESFRDFFAGHCEWSL